MVERERRRMPREAGEGNIENDAHKEPMWWRERERGGCPGRLGRGI